MCITILKKTAIQSHFKLTKKIFFLLGILIWSLSVNGADDLLNSNNKNKSVIPGVKRTPSKPTSFPRIKGTLTVNSPASPPTIESATTVTVGGTSGSQTITNAVASVVDANLTVTADGSISGFIVTITDSYKATASDTQGDVLSSTVTLPSGVTVAPFNETTRSLVFSGSATASEWQAILRGVQLTTSSAVCYPEKRKITFIAGDVYYNPLNEHFYKSTSGSSWTTAKTNAETTSYFGREGYLATITSQSENSFISYLVGENSWIGASDNYSIINAALGYTLYANQAASEGMWYWVTGPEIGTKMRDGNGTLGTTSSYTNGYPHNVGPAVAGVYQNWRTNGEPNDFGSATIGQEDYGHILSSAGDWNDFPNNRSIRSIVEFGGMPNDNTSSQVIFTRSINISNPPSGTITGGDVTNCSGASATLTLTGLTDGTVDSWEYSLDNFLTAGITIANTSTSLTDAPTESTYYRAIVTKGSCVAAPTSSSLIKVTALIAGNTTAQNYTICEGGTAELTLFGNSGNVLNWQLSNLSNFSSPTTIANTTARLSHTLASSGTYYLRANVSGCGGASSYSGYSTINVTSGTPPVGGSINSPSACGPTNTVNLTLTGYTGTISKWQTSTDGGIIWSDIAGTESATTYSLSNVLSRKYFKAVLTDATCGTSYSSVGMVNYYSLPTLTISGATTGFNKVDLTASGGATYSWSDGTATALNSIEESGMYSVSMTDANNCTVSQTVTVQVQILGVSRYGEITSDSTIQINVNGIIGATNPIAKTGGLGRYKKNVNVGDTYKGGIVAYIFQSGDAGYVAGQQHGIIVATDHFGPCIWGPDLLINGTASSLNSGANNTSLIYNALSMDPGYPTYAIYFVKNYSGGGYNDWFLPSDNELHKINNSTILNKIGYPFAISRSTWSSTTIASDRANAEFLGCDGCLGSDPRIDLDNTYYVIPMRYF